MNKITFKGSSGEMLAARLDLPLQTPRAYALFAHCFTCSKDVFAASRISEYLTGHNIAVLRFDFTGLGASEGEFANTNFTSNVDDLILAAKYLEEEHKAPQIIIGHSLGGAAVLSAAKKIPSLEAVVTLNAPAEPKHVVHNFECSLDEITAKGEAEVKLAGRPFKIKKQFIDDLEEQKLMEEVATMKKALLVFHAPKDQQVGVENAAKIFTAAKHPKSFVSLDGADHLLTRKADAIYVAQVIASWVSRYLSDAKADDTTYGPVLAPEGKVTVAETREGKVSNWVSIGGRHVFRADEPQAVGGDDTGGTPYDLLAAALGACTSMTMRMYANFKGLAVDRISVEVNHDKVDHPDALVEEGKKTPQIDQFDRDITIDGDLTEAERAKLIEIANKCPVHRTLHGDVLINTKEV